MTESERIQILQLSRQGLNDNQIAKMMHYSRPHISENLRGMGKVRKRGRTCIRFEIKKDFYRLAKEKMLSTIQPELF